MSKWPWNLVQTAVSYMRGEDGNMHPRMVGQDIYRSNNNDRDKHALHHNMSPQHENHRWGHVHKLVNGIIPRAPLAIQSLVNGRTKYLSFQTQEVVTNIHNYLHRVSAMFTCKHTTS